MFGFSLGTSDGIKFGFIESNDLGSLIDSLEIYRNKSLMVYLMSTRKDGTAHGKIGGLLVGISLEKQYGNVLVSSVRVQGWKD